MLLNTANAFIFTDLVHSHSPHMNRVYVSPFADEKVEAESVAATTNITGKRFKPGSQVPICEAVSQSFLVEEFLKNEPLKFEA